MDKQLLWGIQYAIQAVWIIQVINLNIHKKKNVFIVSLYLFLFNVILTFTFNYTLRVYILLHIINLFSIFFLYKENPQKAVVSYSFAYIIVLIYYYMELHYIFARLCEFVLRTGSLAKYYGIINLCFFGIVIILSKKLSVYIKELVNIICENIVSGISLIISGFFLDIIMIAELNRDINLFSVILINKIMIINMFLFTLAIVYTTIRFDNKLYTMGELNNAMEIKNGELRKIKHDYGAQISYLYGLFLLKRYDDLGKALKDICRKNNEISSAVSIRDNENSIVYKALKPVLEHGIHILLEENIESNSIDISEEDLFTILTAIRNNALKYIDNEGIIIAKVYEVFVNAVIDIENSCTQKRRKKYIGMFKKFYSNFIEGWDDFSSINGIKKIIEENNGEIYIKNKDISTVVRIIIPTKNKYNYELQ